MLVNEAMSSLSRKVQAEILKNHVIGVSVIHGFLFSLFPACCTAGGINLPDCRNGVPKSYIFEPPLLRFSFLISFELDPMPKIIEFVLLLQGHPLVPYPCD